MDPFSIAGAVGGIASGIVGMLGAKDSIKRAEAQKNQVSMFNRNQQAGWDQKMAEMMAAQKAAPTYQADFAPYQAMADKARMNEIQASGQTRAPGTQFALDQADQGYANLVQATGKLGGSRADMATALLMGQQNVGQQKGQALAQGQQMMFQNQQQAKMANLNALGQFAAGKSMENYRSYASQAANQQGMLGLIGQDLSGRMALNQQGFQSEMSAQSILDQAAFAKDNMFGNMMGTIGAGLNQIGMQNMKMKELGLMMNQGGGGSDNSTSLSSILSNAQNVFGSGASLGQTIGVNLPFAQNPTQAFNLANTAGFGLTSLKR
jgi:hypothetical protein